MSQTHPDLRYKMSDSHECQNCSCLKKTTNYKLTEVIGKIRIVRTNIARFARTQQNKYF